MTIELFVDLLTNIVLLMSLSVVYALFSNDTRLSRLSSKIAMGISVSVVGFVIMANAVETNPGIFFDGRSVLMLLTGIFFGVTPTIIGGIFLSIYRIIMGGDGVIPGILWVVIPGIIGLSWRFKRIKNEKVSLNKITIFEQFVLVLLTQMLMVGILFFFPAKVPLSSIKVIAFPLIALYPLGGLAVSIFMLRQRMIYFNSLEIKEREQEYKELFHKSASYSLLIDSNTERIMNVNQAAIERYGYSYEEFTNMTIFDLSLLPEEDVRKKQKRAIKEDVDYITCKHILKNKEIMHVEVRSTPISIEGVSYSYSTITDITDRIKDERKYQDVNVKLESTLNSVNEGIISTNVYGEIEVINDFATSYLSITANAIGKNINDVIQVYSKDSQIDFNNIYNLVMTSNKPFKSKVPYLLMSKEDTFTQYIDFSLSPIFYDEKLRGSILVFRDVTNQFQQNKQIQYISQHDYLTGLYNRYFLEVEMKRLDTKRQLPITIIHGDVNGLKLTNDAFGHVEGDNLIIEIANILKKATRSEDIIARWGGDEFIILLPQTSKENAQLVINRIRDLQRKSMYEVMTPSISLGVATKTDEVQDLNTILIEAETEMYNNKQYDGRIMRQEFLEKINIKLYNVHSELGNHAKQVGEFAYEFGMLLNLDEDDLDSLVKAALYHDIGWINIPDEILIKSENLTQDEHDLILSHSDVGFRIMKSIPELTSIAELILTHHESWDGTGYPHQLKEKEIPYLARVLRFCDALDMMINNTVYSPTISIDEAIEEFKRNKAVQFDPYLTDKFIEYLQKLKFKVK